MNNTNKSTFTKKLIKSFKAFLNEEHNTELDFRKHVFLENQYGGYPQYPYAIAEDVVDGMFSFFDKHNVDYDGRYNRSMSIESLRTEKLKDFLEHTLESEIDEDVFDAVNATEAPKYEILSANLSVSDDNQCLCIDVDDKTKDFITKRLGIEECSAGEGCEGFINIQYPITNESQTYIAGSNWEEDIKNYYDDDLITSLVDEIISEGNQDISRRDWELEQKFGTSNIINHDNMVLHGYYNGLNLALLENEDTNAAYVTFECSTQEQACYFPCQFKEFSDIDEAKDYIRSHINNYQTLQDFGISHAIYNELESEDNH